MTTKTREISNSDDIIDSRDVIARIDELRDEIELAEIPDNEIGGPNDTMLDERTELAQLEALAEDAEGYAEDWKYGATLIRDSYFVEYAEELCKDIGDLPRDIPWYIEIDWEKTAEHIKEDYTSVEYGDVTYWVR